MAKYDVVVIGAGAAGLTAGALLAKHGKKIVVMDREEHLGGRAMAVPFEGYRLSLGGHLLEDGGSGITKIISHLGGELKHGLTSKGMPVWVDGKWQSVQALYSTDKDELKKVIKILCDTDWKELDRVGRQAHARVAAAVHDERRRHRAFRVYRLRRMPHRQVVGPFRQRQSLHPQNALHGAPRRRVLLLARRRMAWHL